jgi:hypothetical protein
MKIKINSPQARRRVIMRRYRHLGSNVSSISVCNFIKVINHVQSNMNGGLMNIGSNQKLYVFGGGR